MARQSNADSEKTFEAILTAARELLATVPAHELSLRRVARSAGVSVSTVAYYFGTRTELLEAVLEGHYERMLGLREELASALRETQPIEQAIRMAAERVFDFVGRDRTAVILRMQLNLERGELTPRRQSDWLGPTLDLAVTLLSGVTGRTPMAVRISLRALDYAVIRFGTMEHSELLTVLGLPDDTSVEEARGHVREHLGTMAVALLGRASGDASS